MVDIVYIKLINCSWSPEHGPRSLNARIGQQSDGTSPELEKQNMKNRLWG